MNKWIWLGLVLGSSIGGYVPTLWDAELLSFASVLGSTLGGAAGIFIGWKISRSM